MTEKWMSELSSATRDSRHLLQKLELMDPIEDVVSNFPLRVTESFVSRMKPGDPNDPLLLQVLPSTKESQSFSGESRDPVGDMDARLAPGLIQKYAGRALLVVTGNCAVHCRYCFRKNYAYQEEPQSLDQWADSLSIIRQDPSLHEIILSGGDPLTLNDSRLSALLSELDSMTHLKRIRVHTRVPIVLPSRITDSMIQIFTTRRMTPIFVIHANHPRELMGDSGAVVRSLIKSGIPILNQAVLLRGVNDTLEIQEALCESLVNLGAIPYYLHQLDKVEGAGHFEVEEDLGRKLIEQLKERLPGYAVPRYVREVAGESSKRWLSS